MLRGERGCQLLAINAINARWPLGRLYLGADRHSCEAAVSLLVGAALLRNLLTTPLVRRLANAVGNFITYLATGLWVADSQCGLKAFGPKALAGLNLRMPGFEFCTEIVREVGRKKWTFVEVPAKVVYSEYTMAKGQSFATGIKTAARILLRSFMR